jgi:murein DD-endopeptidase MepM/ murein hydrolase activator NlpD
MHLIITDAWAAKSRALHLTGVQLVLAGLSLSVVLVLTSLGLYHWVFLEGARQGWPVVGPMVKLLLKSEIESQDAVMRDNLDAMAKRLGQMQARLVQLESLGDRVAGLAGVPPVDPKLRGAAGGVLLAPSPLTAQGLAQSLDHLDAASLGQMDWLTVTESRLFEQKVKSSRLPTQHPVEGVDTGSGFGWRVDPITGHSALHSGLDFPADVGTPIVAAAGGVVVFAGWHAAYGHMIEIDHGNELVTRYAHASRLTAKQGDLVRRGQPIAAVGNTGRSTGAHLHFEVLVAGVPQDPQKFLDAGKLASQPQEARAGPATRVAGGPRR